MGKDISDWGGEKPPSSAVPKKRGLAKKRVEGRGVLEEKKRKVEP